MEPTALIVFTGALFVSAASLGPAVAAIVARVLARARPARSLMLGIALGDLVWLTSAVLGLAFLAKSFALVFLVLKYAGRRLFSVWPGGFGPPRPTPLPPSCRLPGSRGVSSLPADADGRKPEGHGFLSGAPAQSH